MRGITMPQRVDAYFARNTGLHLGALKHRLLRRPIAEALAMLPIPDDVSAALINNGGPYATLLAVAKASESFDLERIAIAAEAANLQPDKVNRALLAATAWASEVTDHWE